MAMLLVVLWDYKKFSITTKRLTKQSDASPTSFTYIVAEGKNMAIMTFYAFFLWPLVLYWELSGVSKK
jgi:hypothetical protein